jgi:hypothetical protein
MSRNERRRKRKAAVEEEDEYEQYRPSKQDARDAISLNYALVLHPGRVMNTLVRR